MQNEYHQSGKAKCDQGDFQSAIADFELALRADPNHPAILYDRAKAYFRLQSFPEALQDFDQLLQLAPDNAFYLSERAVALHLSGDHKAALQDMDKAVALEPNKGFRYSSRAFLRERDGDLQGALADYEKAIALDPEDAISFNNKGLIEEKLGYQAQSKKSYERADSLDKTKLAAKKEASTDRAQEQPVKKPNPAIKVDDGYGTGQSETRKPSSKVSKEQYWDTLKKVLTSKEERKGFLDFLKRGLKKEK